MENKKISKTSQKGNYGTAVIEILMSPSVTSMDRC